MKSPLVKTLGFPATLIHGDTMVLDRWLWLKQRLPKANGASLMDAGCGSGAFSIGAALRGYKTLGLSWDERDQRVAQERALICHARTAEFEVLDLRNLDQRQDLISRFDVAVSCENIEHILDDRKLVRDIAACLKPGGRLLLTTPNFYYKPLNPKDDGPWSLIEDGGHVRKGYTEEGLRELCKEAGLMCDSITFCTGMLSQKITGLYRTVGSINRVLAWGAILPLRLIPPFLDSIVTKVASYPGYSICLEAHKPQ